MTYTWTDGRGSYGRYNNSAVQEYSLQAYVDSIEYGTNPSAGVTTPTARVLFTRGPRCLTEPCYGDENTYKWLDTPWDLNCVSPMTTCPATMPTFWSSARLVSVTTQVRTTSGGWSDVDVFTLKHMFPGLPAGEEPSISLWMWAVDAAGFVGGGPLSAPRTEYFGTHLPNRVNPSAGEPYLRKYRITGIDNHAGGETVVAYNPADSCDTAVYHANNVKRCFPQDSNDTWTWFHKYTVASVTEKDLTGGGPDEKWSYTYSTAGSTTSVLWRYAYDEHLDAFDQSWSIWAGYSTVKVTRGVTAGAQTVTESRYYRGFYGDVSSFSQDHRWDTLADSQTSGLPDHKALAGRVRESTVYDGTAIVSSTIHEPAVTQTAVRDASWPLGDWYASRVDETKTRDRVWLDATATWRWTELHTSYDSYGLPVDVTDLGDTALSSDDRCTHTDYARNTTTYLIAFPSQVISTNCVASPAGGDFLAGVQTLYDGTTTVGATPTRGLPTKTLALSAVAGTTLTWKQMTRATWDSHGRPLDAFDALDRKTTTGYTPTLGGPTTALSMSNNAGHTTTATVERNRGQVTQTVDPNTKTTNLAYDPLGRLLKIWLPGRATNQTPNLEYTYTLRDTGANALTSKRLGPNGNQIVEIALFDGRFRPRQTQSVAPDGKRAIADTVYDNRGLTAKESAFYNNASGPTDTLVSFADSTVDRQINYTYDQADRGTNVIAKTGGVETWRTTYAHAGDWVTVTPPAGGTATKIITRARGQVKEFRQYQAATPTGAYDATTYTYDRLDRLTKVTDPAGNHWDYTYDRRDRLTQRVDPDAGTTTYTYNDAAQPLSVTDSRGEVIVNVYDSLGRLIERRDDSATGPLRASWTYDTLALGALTSSTRWDSGNAYITAVTGYSDLYQPTGTSVTIPAVEGNLAGTYAFGATYHVDGSPATVVHPAAGGLAAETVTTSYANTGLPTSVVGLASYLSQVDYDWDGQVTQQFLGSGTNRVRLTNLFEASTGRLNKMQVHTEHPGAPNTWDEKFTETVRWFDAGTLKSLVEHAAGVPVSAQCYAYDYLQRLTEAWTNAVWNCGTAPASVTNRGPDPYWTTWAFGSTGNRASQVAHSTSGGADTTTAYSYPAALAPQPHTLTSTTGPGGTKTYGYDAAGNTTSRPGPSGQQTLTWDAEGHLATVTQGANVSSYLYDADGQRLMARDPGTTTLHLGSTELRLNTGTGQVTGTRYYPNAVRTTSDGLTWLAGDHHGTNQLTVHPTTLTATRRKSLPYGETRGTPPGSWPDQKGFVNGTTDPTGLTHLGAREYDPGTGRFLSLDPILDHTDPQQMHGYSYSTNNPTTWADPSGLSKICGLGGTDCGGGSLGGGMRAPKVPSEPMITGEITVLDLAAGANPRALMAGFGRPTASQYASRYGSRVADEDIAPGGYYYPSRDPLASHVSPGHSANRQRVNPHAGDGEFAVSVPNPRQQPTPARRNPSQGRDPAPPTSCKHSFDPDTPVLMADGSTKPIKDVDVGDDVMATEPETGRTEAKDVVAVHNNNDTDLTDLTISTADGEAVTTIRTTQHHPFWDETLKRWVLAADLQEGHQLLDNDMSFVTVRAVNSYSGHMAMRDLTVADIHTYYVAAGDHAVLVHNCNEEFFSVQDASDAARLRSGGEPWPTEPHRTAWGEGVYAFDNSASANRYMEQLLARRPDLALEVVRFSVPKVSLGRMRSLDLDSLPQTEIDAFMDQHYIASLPSTHGYEYLTRGTQYGQEHFFDNLCTAR